MPRDGTWVGLAGVGNGVSVGTGVSVGNWIGEGVEPPGGGTSAGWLTTGIYTRGGKLTTGGIVAAGFQWALMLTPSFVILPVAPVVTSSHQMSYRSAASSARVYKIYLPLGDQAGTPLRRP